MAARTQLAAKRRQVGHTQESLAQAIDVSARTVSGWERGTNSPGPRHRNSLADELHLTLAELDILIDESASAPDTSGASVAKWLGYFASLEQTAAVLQSFEPMVIPALLQTAEYARAIERAYHLPVTKEVVEERVAVRLERQKALLRESSPLRLVCIIDQAAISHQVGGSLCLHEQVCRLLEEAERPNIELRITPFEKSPYGVAFGAFHLFTSPGAANPFIACTESLEGMAYVDSPARVADYATLFESLTTQALSPQDSISLLRSTVGNYEQ